MERYFLNKVYFDEGGRPKQIHDSTTGNTTYQWTLSVTKLTNDIIKEIKTTVTETIGDMSLSVDKNKKLILLIELKHNDDEPKQKKPRVGDTIESIYGNDETFKESADCTYWKTYIVDLIKIIKLIDILNQSIVLELENEHIVVKSSNKK